MMHSRYILTKDTNKTDKRKKNSFNGPVELLNYTILLFHLQKFKKEISNITDNEKLLLTSPQVHYPPPP